MFTDGHVICWSPGMASLEKDVVFLEHTGPDVPLVPVPGSEASPCPKKSSLLLKPTSSPLSISRKVDAKGNTYVYLHCSDVAALQKTLSSPESNPVMVICAEGQEQETEPPDEQLDLSNLRLVFDPDEDVSGPSLSRNVKEEPQSSELPESPLNSTPSRYKIAPKEPIQTRSRNRPKKGVADKDDSQHRSSKKGNVSSKELEETPERGRIEKTPKTQDKAFKATPKAKNGAKTRAKEEPVVKVKKEVPDLPDSQTCSRSSKSRSEKSPNTKSSKQTPVSQKSSKKLSKRQEALLAKKQNVGGTSPEPALYTYSPKKKDSIILSRKDSDDEDMDVSELELERSQSDTVQSTGELASVEQASTSKTPKSKSHTGKTSQSSKSPKASAQEESMKKAPPKKKSKKVDAKGDSVDELHEIEPPQTSMIGDGNATAEPDDEDDDEPEHLLDPVTGALIETRTLAGSKADEGTQDKGESQEIIQEGGDGDQLTLQVEAEKKPVRRKRTPKSKSEKTTESAEGEEAAPVRKRIKKEKLGTPAAEGEVGESMDLGVGEVQVPVVKKRGRPRKYPPPPPKPDDYVPRNKRPRGVRRKFSSIYKYVGQMDPAEMSSMVQQTFEASQEHTRDAQQVDDVSKSIKQEKTGSDEQEPPTTESLPVEDLENSGAFEILPDAPPLDDWTLHNGVFLNQDNLFRILVTATQPMYDRVPDGIKENIYFTFDNSENVRRRREGSKSVFHDDCGVWAYKMSSTKKVEFILEDEKLVFINKRSGLYCRKSRNTYFPLAVQPRPEDIVVQRKYYATLKRDSSYRKRITWFESYPGADDSLFNIALAEYLGKYPAEVCIHGNCKLSRTEYRRTEKSVLMKIAAKVQGRKPKDVYQELLQQGTVPRDLRQVQNIKYNSSQMVSDDDDDQTESALLQQPYIIHDGTPADTTLLEKEEAAQVLQQIQANAHLLKQPPSNHATFIQDGKTIHILQEAVVDTADTQPTIIYQDPEGADIQQSAVYQDQVEDAATGEPDSTEVEGVDESDSQHLTLTNEDEEEAVQDGEEDLADTAIDEEQSSSDSFIPTSASVHDSNIDTETPITYVQAQTMGSESEEQPTVYIIQQDGSTVSQEQGSYILQNGAGEEGLVYIQPSGNDPTQTSTDSGQQVLYLEQVSQALGSDVDALKLEEAGTELPDHEGMESKVQLQSSELQETELQEVQLQELQGVELGAHQVVAEEVTEGEDVMAILEGQTFIQDVNHEKVDSPHVVYYR